MEFESYSAMIALPCCKLGVIEAEKEKIKHLHFLPPDTPIKPPTTQASEQVCVAITHYLQNPSYLFNLPLADCGSIFQQRVWQSIRAIPMGEVSTYKALAQKLNSAPRAVGQACGANPFPIVVPCHRVVSSQGLGGFMHHTQGWLVTTKRWLLSHEGVI